MPRAPARLCARHGAYPAGGGCQACKRERAAAWNAERGTAAERYGPGWTAFAKQVLREEPLCRPCQAAGRVRASDEVDHIVPVSVRPDLKRSRQNCQGICVTCHREKTAEEARARRRGRGVRIVERPAT